LFILPDPQTGAIKHVPSTHRHERLFEQYGFQRWVERFPDVLTQDRHADPDTVLQGPQEVAVRQLDDLQPVLVLHVSDPAVGLKTQT